MPGGGGEDTRNRGREITTNYGDLITRHAKSLNAEKTWKQGLTRQKAIDAVVVDPKVRDHPA